MIRSITPEDARAVTEVSIAAGLFPPEDADFLDKMMADFFGSSKDNGHRCVVDDHDGLLIGVAYYEPALATDRTWYLTMIGIRKDIQGQGRGSALMRYVEQQLQQDGQRMLLVETSGTAHFALTRQFYAKLGYTEEARVRDYYAPGDDMVLFRRVLKSAE